MSLPRFAIRRPVTTIMVCVAVVLLGVIAWLRMPQELFPSITYPQISIVTQYKDAAPEEIELLVTSPIEEVVGTVPGIRRVSSVSKEEVSLVIAEFTWGTNMDFASLAVREKLDLIKERLPRGAEDPVVIKYNPFDRPVLILNVSGPLPSYELLQVTRRQIKDLLEKVEGVASVVVTGGTEREILVSVDQGRLQASKTSIMAINEALAKTNLNYPAGTIKEAFYEYLIRTIGEFTVVPEIRDVAVNVEEEEAAPGSGRAQRQQALQRQREQPLRRAHGLQPSPRLVLLRDVATVKDTYKERTSLSRFNGQENISLAVQKQSGANIVQVVTRVRHALEQTKTSLPAGVEVHIVADQSVAIRQAVQGVADAAWQGAVLAFLVLLVFLRNWWAAVNVTAAIPLSILLTLGAMYFSGVSINVISLGGLALGVGTLVDAGIVIVENIDRCRALGMSAREAAIAGAEEVSAAIFGSILTNIVPFLPLIFVYGLIGQLFKDFAFTVTFSHLASLAVSFTLTTLFASWMPERRRVAMAGAAAPAHAPDATLRASWLSRQELKVVRWFLDHRWLGVGIVLLSFVVSVAAFIRLPQELLPKVEQPQFTLKVEMPPGTRLQTTDQVVQRIERQLQAHRAIRDVTVNIGSTKGQGASELVETLGPHQAQIVVGLLPRAQRGLSTDQVIQQLRASLATTPLEGAQLEFLLEDSALKAAAISAAPVVIEVRGERLATLESLADQVAHGLKSIPGLYGVRTSLVPPSPETKVRVLKDRASTYHLSVSDIALTAQTAIKGFVATKFKEGGREIDVRVRLRPQDRHDLGRVRRLMIRSPLQMDVPLAEVAYLAVGRGPTEIRRQDRQRTVVVAANLSQRSLSDATQDVTAMLQRLSVPSGYEVRVTGEREEMQASFNSLLFAAALAFLLIYMVMAATFESLWQPFLIMATIPMSLSGVVVALWLTHTPVSAMVGLGIMLLGGIVVNNGIVLIDFVNQLQRERGLPLYEALLEASQTRLRPIVMTASTAVLGLVPLAAGFAEGAELQGPMAITLMGGLTSSTFLTLVFLPTIFLIVGEWLSRWMPTPAVAPVLVPAPALALAGLPGVTVALPPERPRPEPPALPEIPEDYGREEAVPDEPSMTMVFPTAALGIPEPLSPTTAVTPSPVTELAPPPKAATEPLVPPPAATPAVPPVLEPPPAAGPATIKIEWPTEEGTSPVETPPEEPPLASPTIKIEWPTDEPSPVDAAPSEPPLTELPSPAEPPLAEPPLAEPSLPEPPSGSSTIKIEWPTGEPGGPPSAGEEAPLEISHEEETSLGEPGSETPPAAPSRQETPRPLELNLRQQRLLELLKTVGRLSRKEYAERAKVSIPTAARDLKALVDAGLIRGVGPLGPGRLYELAPRP